MNGEANGPRAPSSKNPSKKGLQVELLDDTVVAFDVEPSLKAEVLFKKVNTHLNLEEAEYFGLQFVDADANLCWLDPLKTINRQLKDAAKKAFKFRVMFYTPDPSGLQEYTRYLFTLQVRRDLLDGRLHCSSETGALLASYIVQGELGDYDSASHREGYLSGFQFVPSQTPEVEQQIVDYHLSHRGLSPADADRSMLEIARQLEMYGVIRYPVLDQEGVALSIAVHHMGLLVYQGDRRMNSFSWANIRKLSFKRRKFLLKLHPGIQENGDVVFFTMRSRDACKNFWKVVVSHHVFFRHKSAEALKRRGASIKRGSKFRYSGRTRKQILDETSGRPHAVDSETSRSTPVRNSRHEATSLESRQPLSVPPASPDYPVANHVPAARVPPTSVSSMSTDEGSYLVGHEDRKPAAEDSDVETDELAEDHVIADSSMSEAKVITLSYQYADDSNEENVAEICECSENVTMNGRLHSDVGEAILRRYSGNVTKTSPDVIFETGTGADSDQDIGAFGHSDAFELDTRVSTITSHDSELADEVNSMFQKINREYSVSGRAWQYQMTSIDKEEDRGKLRHNSRLHGHGFQADATSHLPKASSKNDHEKQEAEDDVGKVADSKDQSHASLDLTRIPVEGETQRKEKLQDHLLESAALASPEL